MRGTKQDNDGVAGSRELGWRQQRLTDNLHAKIRRTWAPLSARRAVDERPLFRCGRNGADTIPGRKIARTTGTGFRSLNSRRRRRRETGDDFCTTADGSHNNFIPKLGGWPTPPAPKSPLHAPRSGTHCRQRNPLSVPPPTRYLEVRRTSNSSPLPYWAILNCSRTTSVSVD